MEVNRESYGTHVDEDVFHMFLPFFVSRVSQKMNGVQIVHVLVTKALSSANAATESGKKGQVA